MLGRRSLARERDETGGRRTDHADTADDGGGGGVKEAARTEAIPLSLLRVRDSVSRTNPVKPASCQRELVRRRRRLQVHRTMVINSGAFQGSPSYEEREMREVMLKTVTVPNAGHPT